jgi:hypothetical protein
MIIFNGTRSFRGEYFLCFSNENESSTEIPVSEEMMYWFMRHIDRISTPTKPVESKLQSSVK